MKYWLAWKCNMAARYVRSVWNNFTFISRFSPAISQHNRTVKFLKYNHVRSRVFGSGGRFDQRGIFTNELDVLAGLGVKQRRLIHCGQDGQGKQNKEFRTNENIKAKNVRLIDQEGKNLGIMAFDSALEMGRKANCLVLEVSSSSSETVCKLINEQQLYAKVKDEKKKHVKTTKTKEIKLTGKISDHDLEIKLRKIREFLEERNSVKVFVAHRKRQNTSLGDKQAVIDNIAKQISDVGLRQGDPRPIGNGLQSVFIPHARK